LGEKKVEKEKIKSEEINSEEIKSKEIKPVRVRNKKEVSEEDGFYVKNLHCAKCNSTNIYTTSLKKCCRHCGYKELLENIKENE
jgi:formylmethanofuran dehydrogenase subunit E